MVQMNHKLAIAKTLFPRVGKTDSSDRSFDLHFGLDAHLKDGRLNLFAHRIGRSPEGWPAKSICTSDWTLT